MSKPLFSIITVTYNASRWLGQTIQSIKEQTYPWIEYIIVDGASTDGTVGIIQQQEEWVTRWVSEPDKGLYDAMNKGIGMATGDYVWFINAGDILYEPDTIQKIVASLPGKSELPDILYGETALIDDKGNFTGMRRLKAPENLTWKSFRMGMLVCHQSFIAKRTLAPLFNTSYRYSSDFDWCIRCLKSATAIHNTHLVLSGFLEEGISSVHRKVSLKERYRIMSRYYGRLTTTLLHGWFAIRFYWAKQITKKV